MLIKIIAHFTYLTSLNLCRLQPLENAFFTLLPLVSGGELQGETVKLSPGSTRRKAGLNTPWDPEIQINYYFGPALLTCHKPNHQNTWAKDMPLTWDLNIGWCIINEPLCFLALGYSHWTHALNIEYICKSQFSMPPRPKPIISWSQNNMLSNGHQSWDRQQG